MGGGTHTLNDLNINTSTSTSTSANNTNTQNTNANKIKLHASTSVGNLIVPVATDEEINNSVISKLYGFHSGTLTLLRHLPRSIHTYKPVVESQNIKGWYIYACVRVYCVCVCESMCMYVCM